MTDSEVVVSAAEAEAEGTAGNGTVVLVLPEVVVDVDSPLSDIALALSTPLGKIRKQARTAMP